MIHRFGPFSLDTGSLELRRDGEPVRLEPQVFSVLAFLVENRDRVVSKDELIGAVWGGRAISDGALNSRINSARRAVGDSGSEQAVIKTYSRRGFRFVAAVSDGEGSEAGTDQKGRQTDRPSIAVMPFANVSNDPEQEYLADGISGDLITELSRVRNFRVVARGSTFSYKGRPTDVRQVAQELGTRYVIEGSVQRVGDRIRLSVQLIDGATGDHVWAHRYNRDIEDIFELQDALTETIVAAVQPAMEQAEQNRVKRKPADSLDAWEAYQRGVWHLNLHQQRDVTKARELFEHATELDPSFAPAHAGLSLTYSLGPYLTLTESVPDAAFAAARRAVELDQYDPDAHTALGYAHYLTRDHARAAVEFQMAIDLNPSAAFAHYQLAGALAMSGDPEGALPHAQTALRLSPNDSNIGPFTARLAQTYFFLGQYEAAVEWARKALHYPNISWPAHVFLIAALARLGREDETREAVDDLSRFKPGFSIALVRERLPVTDAGHLDTLIEALGKAGLPEG